MNDQTRTKEGLREELEVLLSKFKNAEGDIPKDINYLGTPEGKRILEIATCHLGMARAGMWTETTTLLQRHKTTIQHALSSHGIKVPKKKHVSIPPEEIAIIKHYFEKSHSVRSDDDLRKLREDLLSALFAHTGKKRSFNSARMAIREEPYCQWGMTTTQKNEYDRRLCKPIIEDETLTYEQKKKELLRILPHITSWRGVHECLKRLGFPQISHTPRETPSPFSSEEHAFIKTCFEKSHSVRDNDELRKLKIQLLDGLKARTGKHYTFRKVRTAVSEEKFGLWGMTNAQKKEYDIRLCKPILEDATLFEIQKRSRLEKAMAHYHSWKTIKERLTEIGLATPNLGPEKKGWDCVPECNNRIRDLIEKERMLVRFETVHEGVKNISEIIRKEYAHIIKKKNGAPFTLKTLREKIEELVWTPQRIKMLEEVIKNDLVNVFYESHSFIPKEMIEKEERKRVGVITRSPASRPSLRGMGRLNLGEIDSKELLKARLPDASFHSPYKIPAGENATVMVLIPNVGVLYKREDIHENVPRRALAEAEYRGVSAIIISSLFDIDVTKAAGPNKVYRALASGLRTKAENLASSYREEAKRILDEQRLSPEEVELVYVTFAERFESVLEAWEKISYRPKDVKHPELGKEPEYNGHILLVLGYKEELLIAAVAYAEARRATITQEASARKSLAVARSALTSAEKNDFPPHEITKLREQVERFEDEVNRTIITGVPDDLYRILHQRTRTLVIRKLEDTIPNAKVISIGSCVVQVGDSDAGKIAINIPDHLRVTYNLLDDFVASHGTKVLGQEMAPTTVICHPHALFFNEAVRERDKKGKRGSPARVYVAPIALDDEYIRDRLEETIRKVHPISKVVFCAQFSPGVLLLDLNNGMVNGSPIPISSLTASEKKQQQKGVDTEHIHVPYAHDPILRYIYLLTVTDPHYGSRNRETNIWCEEYGKFLGVDEAFFYLLKKSGVCHTSDFPFHMFAMNDDPVQGNHFQVQQQPHPAELPMWKIEEKIHIDREILEHTQSKKKRAELLRELQRFVLRQFALRPPDWTQNQLKMVCHYHVDKNMDIFSSVIEKAVSTKLIFKSYSDFTGDHEDGRDLGCINSGSGNHGLKTLNREMTEGWIIADRILLRLLTMEKWSEKEDLLRRLVRAPLYSNRFMAWGSVSSPGGYEYAFDLRDSPPKMRGWNNTIAGWIKVDPSRGNIQRFAENKFCIKTCGDKHFHATGYVPYAYYMMCAPGTHTDLFAESAGGLPPNNTGISIVGIPKDGPDSGPFVIRHFPFERLKLHVENPDVPFDWKSYLPNPL